MSHPYRDAPARAFWKRAVSQGFEPEQLIRDETLLVEGDRVASAGSCFAANLVSYIEQAGLKYVRTEARPRILGELAEDAFSYSKFSAAYGNIYTVRQLLQLLLRALGRFHPLEDRWVTDDGRIVDPFRPGLRHAATSHAEFDFVTQSHLQKVREALQEATVFVVTLGLTEAWISRRDGAVFPACPGTVEGTFDPDAHEFHNFGVQAVSDDLEAMILVAREINPDLRFILTVSPVPLVATATQEHVLTASTYSKSVLRVAAAEAVRRHPRCIYFPAYEIVTGPQAPHDFFGADRREPSKAAIDTVMSTFLGRCETGRARAFQAERGASHEETRRELSRQIAAALCEEEATQH